MLKKQLKPDEFSSPLIFEAVCNLLEVPDVILQLVVRDSTEINEKCKSLLDKLSPHLLERVPTQEWPGTQLLGEKTATLFRYSGGRLLADKLASQSSRLSDWVHPDFPEDLSVVRLNGEVIFLSITHENDGEFILGPNEEWVLRSGRA